MAKKLVIISNKRGGYMNYIILTDYQKEALSNLAKVMRVFTGNFQKAINNTLKKIEPILNEIRKFIKAQPNLKIKYKIIKIITANSRMMINKPRIIHCRNNC